MSSVLRPKYLAEGKWWGTPKEIWGFRWQGSGGPLRAATAFLREHAAFFGVEEVLSHLRCVRQIESLSGRHVLFRQEFRGVPVHRGYFTVHMSHDGIAYLAKNRVVPKRIADLGIQGFALSPEDAREEALKVIGATRATKRGSSSAPETPGPCEAARPIRRFYPTAQGLRPAYRVRVMAEAPWAEWIVHLDGMSGEVLALWDNLAWATGRGLVFDPNPVARVRNWRKRLVRDGRPCAPPEEAYSSVVLEGLLAGDMLDGRLVTTRPTKSRLRSPSRDYCRRAGDPGFLEVMAYYHADRVLRYLESMGYRGKRAIFTQAHPLALNAHGSKLDNSWYSPARKRITLGTGGVDDAEDAEVIVHEVGHAIQDAICPDFGLSDEAAALGEGFSDYLAASFFADKKPKSLRPCIMAWDRILEAVSDKPSFRRVDERLTYKDFVHGEQAEEHENGTIWSSTLWEIRGALGQEVADKIIVESHFQLDAYATFAQAARAIVDADAHLYDGRHGRMLVRIFEKRGIGPLG